MSSIRTHRYSEKRNRQERADFAKVAICVAASCLLSGPASAEWLFSPSVSLESQHSSNFQLFTGDELQDSLISNTAIAGLRVKRQTENTQIDGRVELSYSTFSGARLLDDIDRQYVDLRFRRRLERGSFGLGVSVRRDDLFRFVNSLSDPEGVVTDVDDDLDLIVADPNSNLNITSDQITRTASSYRAFGQYRLTERNSVQVSYAFVNRNIDAPDTLSATSVVTRDTDRHNVGIQFSRSTSERGRFSWNNRASRVDTAQFGSVDIYESTIGWSGRLNEQTRLAASLGANTTDGGSNDRTGLAARAQLSHQVSWGTVDVQASRGFRSTITGNVNETDNLRLSINRPLGSRWNLRLDASGNQIKRSTNTLIDDRIRTVRGGSTLSWNFSRAWEVSAGYRYTFVDRELELVDGTGTDHAGILSISYEPSGARL